MKLNESIKKIFKKGHLPQSSEDDALVGGEAVHDAGLTDKESTDATPATSRKDVKEGLKGKTLSDIKRRTDQ